VLRTSPGETRGPFLSEWNPVPIIGRQLITGRVCYALGSNTGNRETLATSGPINDYLEI